MGSSGSTPETAALASVATLRVRPGERAAGLEPLLLSEPMFDSSLVLADAAAQGDGVALLPARLFSRDLRGVQLVCPFDTQVDLGSYWLTRPKAHEQSHAMQAFRDWLTESCRRP